MQFLIGLFGGLTVYAFLRVIAGGLYTVKPDQRAVLTSFGRAHRLPSQELKPEQADLSEEEKERYDFPAVSVIGPGGPYFQVAVARGAQGERRHASRRPLVATPPRSSTRWKRSPRIT